MSRITLPAALVALSGLSALDLSATAAAPGPTAPARDSTPVAPGPEKGTRIEFKVTPASVVIFLDGRRLGTAGEVGVVDAKPGRRLVRLARGGDETELEVDLERGKTLRFAYDFGE